MGLAPRIKLILIVSEIQIALLNQESPSSKSEVLHFLHNRPSFCQLRLILSIGGLYCAES
jgi:hypothetical protein